MSTIKVNNIQPLTGTAVTVVANNSLTVSGTGQVNTPKVQGASGVTVNASSGDIKFQLAGSDKLTVLTSPTGSNKTVNVVGNLYVTGGIYGNGANITGVLAAGSGGTTSSGNLTIQYGTGGSGDAVYSANTTEVARMYYNGNFGVGSSATNPVLFVDKGNTAVGVNTNAPTANLHVLGTAKVTSALTVGSQMIGGIGANTTAGTTDWNDASNARSGQGYTLLYGNATNGFGVASKYFHSFSFEYASKDGTGNVTQFAIPYTVDGAIDNTLCMRSRTSGTWGVWRGFVQQPVSVNGISVDSAGKVGINNTAPGSILDVTGDSQITGRLTIANPASGNKAAIAFPAAQTDTALANALDDYEEGAFTPTIAGLVNFSAYTTQRGNYTKVGNRVYFDLNLVFTTNGTAASGTTAVTVGGLPLTPITLANYSSPVSIGLRTGFSATAANKPRSGVVSSNSTAITLYRDDMATAVNSADMPFNTTHTISISGHYITNTA